MAQHDRARLLWRQCTELANEIRLHRVGRIRISGPPQALQDCPDLEQTLPAALDKGHVQSDPKEPRFRWGILLPRAPRAESAQVSLLGRILRGRRAFENDHQRREDALVGRPVQAVEIVLASWAVGLGWLVDHVSLRRRLI